MGLDTKIIGVFYNSIQKTDFCWNWAGKSYKDGMPLLQVGTIKYSPRRVSLLLVEKVNKLHDRSELIKPWCQNKLCVNPDHLVVGNEARFYAKVQRLSEANGGCWVWMGAKTHGSYGVFTIHTDGVPNNIRAHVYSWQLHNKFEFTKGMVIMHSCDHPWCVNPDHLSLGTQKDNVKDMISKGRNRRGCTHSLTKLTEQSVRDMRAMYETGNYSHKQLGKIYDVSATTVWQVINRKTFYYLP